MNADTASIHISINGHAAAVSPGTTILEAARQNGVEIPSLCYHPELRPEGACRLCLVEVEGMRALQTACTLPVAEGMSVKTETPEIRAMRKEILSLILSEHPYSCLICDRHSRCGQWQTTIRKAAVTTGCENCPMNGQCELQALVEQVGLNAMPYPITYRGVAVEKADPFFDRDYNLCVLCGRCVRVCQEVRFANVLGFQKRGSLSSVGVAPGFSFVELGCEFCGSCVDVCPTGALFDKRTKWEGVPDFTAKSICPYCSVGCEIDVQVRRGKIIGVRPSFAGPANQGQICVRGRYGVVDLVHAEDRLSIPRIRKLGKWTESDWDEAFGYAANMLERYKGESLAIVGSANLSNESLYMLHRFAKEAMKTSNVSIPALSPDHDRAEETRDALLAISPAAIDSIRDASVIFAIGTNPRLSHPVVAVAIRQAVRQNGAKLIVIDPRETDLAREANVWLRPEPGGDFDLLQALGKKSKSPDANVARAQAILQGDGAKAILFGSGVIDQLSAPDIIGAVQKLAKKHEAGILPLLGASNTRGVLEACKKSGVAPIPFRELVRKIDSGEVKALYIAGEFPPMECLAKLDLIILQDSVSTPGLEEYAHILLPASTFAEASGTLTNLGGRDQAFQTLHSPVGDSHPDWLIFSQLAVKMGLDSFAHEDINAVRSEMRSRKKTRTIKQTAKQPREAAPSSAGAMPFLLITERNTFAHRNFSLTARVRGMEQVKDNEGIIVLHPEDAEKLLLREEETVRVVSTFGADTFPVRIRAQAAPGLAFASISVLEGSAIFPGRLPSEKTLRVSIEKAEPGNGNR